MSPFPIKEAEEPVGKMPAVTFLSPGAPVPVVLAPEDPEISDTRDIASVLFDVIESRKPWVIDGEGMGESLPLLEALLLDVEVVNVVVVGEAEVVRVVDVIDLVEAVDLVEVADGVEVANSEERFDALENFEEVLV